jgi:23S rRNA (cytosine1962-C5)-methyltransferase
MPCWVFLVREGNVTFEPFMAPNSPSILLPPLLDHIEKAWQSRADLRSTTNSLRIVNGLYSGWPGLVLDLYAEHLVLFAYAPQYRTLSQVEAGSIAARVGATSLTLKDRTQPGEAGREGSRLVFGSAPEVIEAEEHGLRYRIELAHPSNVGLFLDTRAVRGWLKVEAQGQVLNLFSYTCSLGVAAQAAGAETTNVDISKRYLAWGRENYQRNDLPDDPTSFRTMHAERYLDWALGKGQVFDMVVLDPPSFSRFEGKTFTLARDYARLVAKCAALIAPGGTLIAMANFSEASPARMREWILPGLVDKAWRHAEWSLIQPEADFDVPEVWRATDEGMLVGWRISQR